MHELLAFFVRNCKWFIFIILVILSSIMLFRSNPYQHHVYLTSANAVSAGVYNVGSGITSYFSLRDINEDLNRRNAALEQEVTMLKEQLSALRDQIVSDTMTLRPPLEHYRFILAHVIKNSIVRPHNYITLNKGRADGVLPEMGVIDQNGVVGIVNVVGENSCRVISLLNSNLSISCKIKDSEHFGSLEWDGADPSVAMLKELPRHTVFQPGDTIVTSGYSAVFPAGIMVGTVMADQEKRNENFFTLKVKLSTDFTTLSDVQIVENVQKPELNQLEKSDINNTGKTPAIMK